MHSQHSTDTPPFGPLSAYIHRRQPEDAAYIESLRKSFIWWDRWRWLGIALHLGILVAVVCLADRFVFFIRGMQAMLPAANPNVEAVILAGACAGATFGFMLQGSIWGIISAISGLRSERLLVRYYDHFRNVDSRMPQDSHVDAGLPRYKHHAAGPLTNRDHEGY